MEIEPTIFRFEVGRLIHWATRPYDNGFKTMAHIDTAEEINSVTSIFLASNLRTN